MTEPNPQGSGGGVTSAALDGLLGSTDGLYAKRVAGAWTQAAAGGGPNTVSSGYVGDPSTGQVLVPYAASPTYTTVGTYDVGVVDGDQVVLFFLVFTAFSTPGQAIAELILEASLDNGSTWDPVFYDGEFSTAGAGGYAATVSIPVAVEASSGDHVKFRLRAWVYYGAADSIAFNPSGSGSNGKNWRAATKQ